MVCSRPRLLLAVVALFTACSEGDNDDGTGTISATVGATVGDTTQAPTTEVPTTGEPAGTSTGAPDTTGEPDTSTTAAPTTGEPDPSTGSDETGPICDPGMPNCVCDNGGCVDGYVCENDVCTAGLACQGDVEPALDDEQNPLYLGDITDNDDDYFDQPGVLSGSADADWYSFHGADTLGYVAEASFTVVSGAQRNCVFLECDDGGAAQTSVQCPGGSNFAISPMLRPGCCSDASFTIKDLNCPGNDESLTAWIRIDKPSEDVCSPYEFKTHF